MQAQVEVKIIDNLVALIDENISNPSLNVDFICKKMALSRSKLHRIVTDHSETSTTLFIRKIKLQKAKDLLLNSTLRISEIAYAIGIDSPQNFSQYFTETFNISPSEYRKNYLPSPTTSNVGVKSIAVLPFNTLSSEIDQRYFSDGITEEIINLLAKVPELKVVGRTAAFTYKGLNIDIRKIGKQLAVDYILMGNVRISGNTIRVIAQLIEVESGFHLWSDKYDKELKDIFEIQDEISLAILNEIKIKLIESDKVNLLKKHTNNPQAHQQYLYGRFFYNKFGSKADFLRAIQYFEEAIALEPNYALAYTGIASCYLYLWFYRHLPREECFQPMKNATEKALEIDQNIAESQLAKGMLKLYFEWDFVEAKQALSLALELNGNMAEALIQNALCAAITGQKNLANERVAKGLQNDPFSLINHYYAAYVCWINEEFEKAIKIGRKLVELEPSFWGGHTIIGFNAMDLGRLDEAKVALEAALNQHHNAHTLSGFGVLYHLLKNQTMVGNILAQTEQLALSQPVNNFDYGILKLALGDKSEALVFFNKAIELKEPPMLFFKYILRDWFVAYHNDADCLELIAKIGWKS